MKKIDPAGLLALPLVDQLSGCLEALGKAGAMRHCASCLEDARRAIEALGGRTMEEHLEAAGLSVVDAEGAACPGSLLRAVLDLDGKRITVYGEPMRELEEAMERFPLSFGEPPRRIVLAHELFHLLAPGCPPERAEMSAHLFATLLLKLPHYAGLLDAAHLAHRRGRAEA